MTKPSARGRVLLALATAAVLVLPLVQTTTASAAKKKHRVTVSARVAKAHRVVVSGHTPRAHAKVVLQRRVKKGKKKHWKKVAHTRTHRHRFKVRISQKRKHARYRAVSGRAVSRTFAVSMPKPPSCGGKVRKADGKLWTCTFSDDFTGTSLNRSKWVPQKHFVTGTPADVACYFDDPSVIKVSGGALQLGVRKVPSPIACPAYLTGRASYIAGSVSTYHLFSQKYGRFQARMKVTASTTPGLHEAFWLWPDDRVGSTKTGEIDVAELYSSKPDLAIPFVHYAPYNKRPRDGLNTSWSCSAKRGVYNTYTLEWSPSSITIFVNGKVCLVNRSGDDAFKKPEIILFTQGLGPTNNPVSSSTTLPATTSVDYVRVWK